MQSILVRLRIVQHRAGFGSLKGSDRHDPKRVALC